MSNSSTPFSHLISDKVTISSSSSSVSSFSSTPFSHLISGLNSSSSFSSSLTSSTSSPSSKRSSMKRSVGELKNIGFQSCSDSITPLSIGTLNDYCPYCGAKRFEKEPGRTKHNCCHQGKVKLPRLMKYPDPLYELICGSDSTSSHFRNNIRNYNSAYSFVSFGAHQEIMSGPGPYVYKVSGTIYHSTPTSLIAPANTRPIFSQLYFFDDSDSVRQRFEHPENSRCRFHVMEMIQQVLSSINPYIKIYRNLGEVIRQYGLSGNFRLVFGKLNANEPAIISRRYNDPQTPEIAAIITGDMPPDVDFCVYPRLGEANMTHLSHLSPNLDPMTFILLFPSGDPGWSPMLLNSEGKRLTQLQFYSYRLAVRDEFNPLHVGGRLFQQFIVHAYVLTETSRLNFLRGHQRQIRADSYAGLLDYVQHHQLQPNIRPGNLIILPSTFVGSPRFMAQNFQDTLAIVRRYGKPDFFITMTCNPEWEEIQQSLMSFQTSTDRPDIVARVFNAKAHALIKLLTKDKVFGTVKAYAWVIEFQKRGLPHMHLLLTLKHKIHNIAEVDQLISAQIPNAQDPELRSLVLKHMIHGPHTSSSACMVNGQCIHHYPKAFADSTLFAHPDSPFPIYQRSADTIVNTTKGRIHNGWVVPYNPFLLLKFQSHINVELCASVLSCKYLYKYIYKGHDSCRTTLTLDDPESLKNNTGIVFDEIQMFQDSRYICPPEAAYRLLECPLHGKSHSVQRLAVHLEDEQHLYFNEGAEEAALVAASTRKSTLTAFFELNQKDEFARSLLYTDIPKHYIFDPSSGWQKRKRGQTIARLVTVSPRDTERFFLRMLLLRSSGMFSFNDLKTIDGITYQSYRDAAFAKGLITTDNEWMNCMEEASNFAMPASIRSLFSIILSQCNLSAPITMWNRFKFHMSEDFLIQGASQGLAEEKALFSIDQQLRASGLSCEQIGLPVPTSNLCLETNSGKEYQDLDQLVDQLNPEQRMAFDTILNALPSTEPTHRAFLVLGPGGCGKTFLYNVLIKYLQSRTMMKIICVAWTGIAATLLPGGRTAHSVFKLPLIIDESSTCLFDSATRSLLHNTEIIIWDEISMTPKLALEAVDRSLRDLMGNSYVFGGKLTILGGDFRQLLPVTQHASKVETINASLTSSLLFSQLHLIQLTVNMRVNPNEISFIRWLQSVGEGKVGIMGDFSKVLIPHWCHCDDIVEAVFGDCSDIHNRAILCPKNIEVSAMNDAILSRLPGTSTTLLSNDSLTEEEDQLRYPEEFLNSIDIGGLPPHRLRLKLGAPVMLLRNLSIQAGLSNGTRLEVLRISDKLLTCKVLSGSAQGEEILLPRIPMTSTADKRFPFSILRRQFPVRLAFSMTINKSQGQSFDKVGIFLNQPVFAHGQLYVALSRVKSFQNLYVYGLKQRDNFYFVDNVVYAEIIERILCCENENLII